MSFKIIQCPPCGQIQVTESEKTLKCKSCNRSTSLDRIEKLGCFYASTDNPLQASAICKHIKMHFKGKFKIKDKSFVRKTKTTRDV